MFVILLIGDLIMQNLTETENKLINSIRDCKSPDKALVIATSIICQFLSNKKS